MAHTIQGNGIFTYICHKNQPNVGKYTIQNTLQGTNLTLESSENLHSKLPNGRGYVIGNPGGKILHPGFDEITSLIGETTPITEFLSAINLPNVE